MRGFYLFALIFLLLNSANGQSKLDWLNSLDTIDVSKLTLEELRECIDTVNLEALSISDQVLFDKKLQPIIHQFKQINNLNKVPKGKPAMTIYVGGMECNQCIENVEAELKHIEGVVDLVEANLESDEIIFSFEPEMQDVIGDKVIETLRKKLEGCNFNVMQLYEKDFPENVQLIKEREKQRDKIVEKGCLQHKQHNN